MPDLPQTMSAWRLLRHGGPEALEWRTDLPVPQPAPGEVLIRCAAASVNNTDINTRIGWYARSVRGATEGAVVDGDTAGGWDGALSFPRIQGADCTGTIVAVGDGVPKARIGTRTLVRALQVAPDGKTWTFGSECDGGFAEFAVARTAEALPLGDHLTDAEAAALPCAYSTALALIRRAGVAQGDHVLITGASGGVGAAAVQICAALDTEITAITSARKADAVCALGAHHCLDRDETPVADSADVILDLVGGPTWPRLLDALRREGTYGTSGAIAGPIVELDLRDLYLRDLTLVGSTKQPPEIMPDLIALTETAGLRPAIAATYPLADLPAAQAAFETKAHVGKIVLTIAD